MTPDYDLERKRRRENPEQYQDPKPPRRKMATKKQWREIHEHFAGSSCVCGLPFDHLHHVRPRSHSGSDEIGNLIGLCATCHDLVHAMAPATCHLVRNALTDKHFEYLGATLGFAGAMSFLDRRYPLLREVA